jgi:hypothetical protein
MRKSLCGNGLRNGHSGITHGPIEGAGTNVKPFLP